MRRRRGLVLLREWVKLKSLLAQLREYTVELTLTNGYDGDFYVKYILTHTPLL